MKKQNAPKDPIKALKKANRDEDIRQHGKSTAFRPTITKNKKKYDRKKEKAVALNEIVDAIYEKVLNEIRKYGQTINESKWSEDEVRAQIEREGGMSWTDEDLGLKFYIKERKSSKDGQPVYVVYDKDNNMVAASRYLEKAQRSLYNNVVVALEQDDFDMGIVRQNDIDESLGYDMNTPEGRAGANDWMHYIMSHEDSTEAAANEWAQENGFGGDENIISAFKAGVEYGRNY